MAMITSEKENTEKPLSILEYLKGPKIKERLQQALGQKANIEEFLSNILVEIGKSPKLMQCTFDSIVQCAIDSANFGLIPNKQLGHAYLIPYENSYKDDAGKWLKRMECQLQIGYKGYIKKFAEYGMNIELELVTTEEIENGKFEESRGSNPYIKHTPIRRGIKTAKNIACGYAIGRCDGRKDIMAVMSLEEIMEAAKTEQWDSETRSKVKSLKGAWINNARETDFGEMCKKTLVRRLAKISDIDVVNKISSYEGDRDTKLVDVTPRDNSALAASFMNQNTTGDISPAPANKLDELLANNLTNSNNSINASAAELKCQEIISALHGCKNKNELEEVTNKNTGHILAMEDSLSNMVHATIEECRKNF